jgi:predicted O-methyltransferase YrrM
MTQQAAWEAVDDYVVELFLAGDDAWRKVLARSEAEGLPDIQVSPAQGALLQVLALAVRARRILEVGTLGGFSTMFLARALGEDGRVLSLEADPRHASVARANLEEVGLADRVEIVEGDAHATLQRFGRAGVAPFDFVFLDAEKEGYVRYLEEVLPLTHAGTVIVADNVVRRGLVADPDSGDPRAEGARSFNAQVAAHPALEGIVLQTVGRKGHDGLAIAVVLEGAHDRGEG